MPQIHLRPVEAADLPALAALDHHYYTEQVWQIEVYHGEDGQIETRFRPQRLPRPAQAAYPRPPQALLLDWQQRPGLLAAVMAEQPIGYISLSFGPPGPQAATAWVSDLCVHPDWRRQGVGAALLLAGLEWAAVHDCQRLVLEMQPKNAPAIRLAQKLGFAFTGYQDTYYLNRDPVLFFSRFI
jgi:ribosomal protein S18 acetylase RimI-like enzyme